MSFGDWYNFKFEYLPDSEQLVCTTSTVGKAIVGKASVASSVAVGNAGWRHWNVVISSERYHLPS